MWLPIIRGRNKKKMFCGKCGTKIEGNEKFCPVCGNEIHNSNVDKGKRVKKGKRKIWVGILLLLIIAGAGGVFLLRESFLRTDYIALAANEDGLFGYINTKGETVIDYQYGLAFDFSPNGLALVADKTDQSLEDLSDLSYPQDYEGFHFRVVDTKGKEVFDLGKYDIVDIVGFQDSSLLAVGEKIGVDDDDNPIYRWGFVNEKGEEVIGCQYDRLSNSSAGYAVSAFWSNGWLPVTKNNQQGIINEQGKYVIPLDDQEFDFYNNTRLAYQQGIIAVERDGKVGFIDENNEIVIPFEYEDASYFGDDGRAWVEKEVGIDSEGDSECLWGMIDKENNVVIPFEYSRIGFLGDNGLISVEKKVGIDEDGDPIYRYGFIDREGKTVIPYEYEYTSNFSDESIAAVCGDDGWFLIDEKGNELAEIECFIDDVLYTAYGLMSINYYTDYFHWKIIDSQGKVFWPIGEDEDAGYTIVSSVESDSNKRLVIAKSEDEQNFLGNQKMGLIDEKGNVILPFIYDDILFCPMEEKTWVWTVNRNSYGKIEKSSFFDLDGNVVFEMPEGYYCQPFVKINK